MTRKRSTTTITNTAMRATAELKLLSDVGLEALPYTERLLLALEAVMLAELPQARDAERYAARIRFATARVDELQCSADALGGVFEPARLEIAIAILDNHTSWAATFVEAIVARASKPKTRAGAYADVTSVESSTTAERRAA